MTWQMQLQLTLQRPVGDGEAGRMLRSWFAGAFEAMGAQLRVQLLEAEPLSDYNLRGRPVEEPYGKPGEVWATVRTSVMGPRGVRSRMKAFSGKSWNAFLDGLSMVPFDAELDMCTLDHQGFPNAFPVFSVSMETNDEDDGWLFLNVRFGPELLDNPDYQRSTLDFAHGFAGEWNPAYGEISYDRGIGRTAFENIFRGLPSRTSLTSRETLRGYGWLTICPQEIGDRLGGLDALRSSGAFSQVEHLGNGGYWLLATPDWRAFGFDDAERMFPVLAPALRPGDPIPDAADDPPYYVSRRNAAELQG